MAERNTYFQDEVVTQEKIDFKNLKRLLHYAAPHKKLFAFVLIVMLIAVVSSMVTPPPSQDDRRYGHSQVFRYGGVHKTFILAVCGFVVCGVCGNHHHLFSAEEPRRAGHGIIADIRKDIFINYSSFPSIISTTDLRARSSVRVTEYITELAYFFISYLMNFILNIVKIVVVTVFMLVLSPVLTLIVYAAIVPLTACVILHPQVIRKLFRLNRAKGSNRTAFILESIMGREDHSELQPHGI